MIITRGIAVCDISFVCLVEFWIINCVSSLCARELICSIIKSPLTYFMRNEIENERLFLFYSPLFFQFINEILVPLCCCCLVGCFWWEQNYLCYAVHWVFFTPTDEIFWTHISTFIEIPSKWWILLWLSFLKIPLTFHFLWLRRVPSVHKNSRNQITIFFIFQRKIDEWIKWCAKSIVVYFGILLSCNFFILLHWIFQLISQSQSISFPNIDFVGFFLFFPYITARSTQSTKRNDRRKSCLDRNRSHGIRNRFCTLTNSCLNPTAKRRTKKHRAPFEGNRILVLFSVAICHEQI